MLGAIYGDIVGSVYEFNNVRNKEFEINRKDMRFTDDTVLTVATMEAFLHPMVGFALYYKLYFRKYVLSNRGFGGMFYEWGMSNSLEAYHSYGNGSGMRVSPVGFTSMTIEDCLKKAKISAQATHNHPEGIKGAQAIALAIFYAKQKKEKAFIKEEIESRFNYDLNLDINEIRKNNSFDETCQTTVPQAIFAFLIGNDFEDVIKTAISMGGDSDTIANMAGGIAEAYYGLSREQVTFVMEHLDQDLRDTIISFYKKFKLFGNR